MKLIVPIAGSDTSFYNEFSTNKYFTTLGRNKLIDYSLKIFKFLPKSTEYIFICRGLDYKQKNFKKKIESKCGNTKAHFIVLKRKTKTSIYSILHAKKFVKSNEKIIIIHPDAYSIFNKKRFLNLINNNTIDGIVFGYKNFNPQDYYSNNTGRLILDNSENILKVNEKDYLKNNDATCAGIYYFKNWSIFEKNSNTLNKIRKNNYIGDLFNILINKKMKVKYFQVDFFINLGSVASVNEFNFWYKYYKKRIINSQKKQIQLTNLIPAAGSGSRHKKDDFSLPKPFIPINKKPMILTAAKSLPRSTHNIFIFKENIKTKFKKEIKQIKNKFSNVKIISLQRNTKGMAITCLKAEKYINKSIPLIISSCDYSFTYNYDNFLKTIRIYNPDAMIWTTKGYPDARIDPNSYAYVKVKNNRIVLISEKSTISSKPHKDHIVTGTFYFKNWYIFEEAVQKMISEKKLINNEYYVATAIQEILDNKVIMPFEIDQFISWSLPFHLKTYYYWENYFKQK